MHPAVAGVEAVASAILLGMLDAVHLVRAVSPLVRSPAILLAVVKCIATNAALILGSECLLWRGLLPLTRMLGEYLHGHDLDDSWWLVRWVEFGVRVLFYVAWLAPIWGLVWATNLSAFSEVADKAFDLTEQTRAPLSVTQLAQQETFRGIFFAVVLAQKYAVQVVPWVGAPVAAAFSTLLCALYSFEYTWGMQGVPVVKRLRFVEENWAYFVGFGTPTVLLTFFWPLFVSLALYAMVLPFCIVLATTSNDSADRVHQRSKDAGVPRLPIFTPTFKLVHKVLHAIDEKFGASPIVWSQSVASGTAAPTTRTA